MKPNETNNKNKNNINNKNNNNNKINNKDRYKDTLFRLAAVYLSVNKTIQYADMELQLDKRA